MRLEEWLKSQKMTTGQFAKKIGVSRSQVHKYLYEGAIPRPEILRRIFIVTNKAVTANDFYGITFAIVEIKDQSQKQKLQYEDYENVED